MCLLRGTVILFNFGVLMDCVMCSICNVMSRAAVSVDSLYQIIRISEQFYASSKPIVITSIEVYIKVLCVLLAALADCTARLLKKAHFILDSNDCS